jgi:hypothetical protein
VAIVVCWIECIYSFGYNFIIWWLHMHVIEFNVCINYTQ